MASFRLDVIATTTSFSQGCSAVPKQQRMPYLRWSEINPIKSFVTISENSSAKSSTPANGIQLCGHTYHEGHNHGPTTAMAEFESFASYVQRAGCNAQQPTSYTLLMNQKSTINPHILIRDTSIVLHGLQPAISTIKPLQSLTLMHRIRITNPIAITPVMRAHEIKARARTDAIFESVDPDAHEVVVGLVGVAEEVVGSVVDDGIVGRGHGLAVACGYHG